MYSFLLFFWSGLYPMFSKGQHPSHAHFAEPSPLVWYPSWAFVSAAIVVPLTPGTEALLIHGELERMTFCFPGSSTQTWSYVECLISDKALLKTVSSASVCHNNEQKWTPCSSLYILSSSFCFQKKNAHWKMLGVYENMEYFSLIGAKFVQANRNKSWPWGRLN